MMWQCSWCKREYSSQEFLALPKVQAVPEDTNPREQHGYIPVCLCGRVFHGEKWKLQQVVGSYWVSTVHLELNHGFGQEQLWYETMIFKGQGVGDGEDEYCDRYTTQEEAEAGHKRVVEALQRGISPKEIRGSVTP